MATSYALSKLFRKNDGGGGPPGDEKLFFKYSRGTSKSFSFMDKTAKISTEIKIGTEIPLPVSLLSKKGEQQTDFSEEKSNRKTSTHELANRLSLFMEHKRASRLQKETTLKLEKFISSLQSN
ncbi:MAG: hypothetical protein JSR33_08740 [Proteobacteria bacterium]|nr:hypothetical protein [Pseudomonadota bacterium]